MTRYERICFDKQLISVSGKPLAAFICPGHPLLDATIDLVLEYDYFSSRSPDCLFQRITFPVICKLSVGIVVDRPKLFGINAP
ncbi:hypothetical protein [Myxosarcina sp. GI1(2024)]